MLTFAALWLSFTLASPALRDDQGVVIEAHGKDRRWVLAPLPAGVAHRAVVTDDTGSLMPSQSIDDAVYVLVPFIPAGASPRFALREGPAGGGPSMALLDDPAGFISVRGPDREITRYHVGDLARKHRKPFFYPLVGHGVNLLRGWPMEDKPGDPQDHPHHTGLYFAYGGVNGNDYWSKLSITPRQILLRSAGPAFARIVAENAWGDDLVEIREVTILNAGPDVVMDWKITLTAVGGPVAFAKNVALAKEGAFAARLAAGLSEASKNKDLSGSGVDVMLDARGNKGEGAIRADRAPWVDYSGEVEGKKVGISILCHPTSFRHPSDWHVRAYGLLSSNPWIVRGESALPKGESLVLKYRVFVHAGDAARGRVADVFEGYANVRVAGVK